MIYQYTDITIIGGGMIGSALALGLAKLGFSVIVIEKNAPPVFDPRKEPNVRISAINIASVDFLRGLSVWEAVLNMRAHPYRKLEFWAWKSTRVTFNSAEVHLPQLGYMVENNVIQIALWKALKIFPEVKIYVPASLQALYKKKDKSYLIILDNGNKILTKMVVGADGANSKVRKIAGIGIHTWKYQQSCMLITIKYGRSSGDTTWQYFSQNGPRAFLPLFDQWASLVWYDSSERIHQLQKMSMDQLHDEIKKHFPIRLGSFIPVSTDIFSLVRLHALKYVVNSLVLVGDAAHTVHPSAGQGVNLGYRDVSVLLKVIADARNYGESWTSNQVLKRYQTERMIDNFIMQSGIDLCRLVLSKEIKSIQLLRNFGIMFLESTSALKNFILKYAVGV